MNTPDPMNTHDDDLGDDDQGKDQPPGPSLPMNTPDDHHDDDDDLGDGDHDDLVGGY